MKQHKNIKINSGTLAKLELLYTKCLPGLKKIIEYSGLGSKEAAL